MMKSTFSKFCVVDEVTSTQEMLVGGGPLRSSEDIEFYNGYFWPT